MEKRMETQLEFNRSARVAPRSGMSRLVAMLLGSLLVVTGMAVQSPAVANDQAVGTLFGAGIGAMAGQRFGGQDGAIVGGVVGAVVGSQLAHGGGRHGYREPTIIFGPPIWSPPRPPRLHHWRSERRLYREERAYREGYREGRRDAHRNERRHQRRWSSRDRW